MVEVDLNLWWDDRPCRCTEPSGYAGDLTIRPSKAWRPSSPPPVPVERCRAPYDRYLSKVTKPKVAVAKQIHLHLTIAKWWAP